MKVLNEARLEFPSLSANESFARSCAACFAAKLDPTLEELGDLKTAVSEAVTNCIVHAYPETIGRVELRLRILEEDLLEVRVRDWGAGIPDVEQAMTPLFTTGGEDRSGMGFSIMECFTDALRVRSKPGKGTTVNMRKRVSGKAVK